MGTRTTKFGATVIKLLFYKDLSVWTQKKLIAQIILMFDNKISLPDDKKILLLICSNLNKLIRN